MGKGGESGFKESEKSYKIFDGKPFGTLLYLPFTSLSLSPSLSLFMHQDEIQTCLQGLRQIDPV